MENKVMVGAAWQVKREQIPQVGNKYFRGSKEVLPRKFVAHGTNSHGEQIPSYTWLTSSVLFFFAIEYALVWYKQIPTRTIVFVYRVDVVPRTENSSCMSHHFIRLWARYAVCSRLRYGFGLESMNTVYGHYVPALPNLLATYFSHKN